MQWLTPQVVQGQFGNPISRGIYSFGPNVAIGIGGCGQQLDKASQTHLGRGQNFAQSLGQFCHFHIFTSEQNHEALPQTSCGRWVRECVGGHSEGKKRRDTKQREKVRGRRTG